MQWERLTFVNCCQGLLLVRTQLRRYRQSWGLKTNLVVPFVFSVDYGEYDT